MRVSKKAAVFMLLIVSMSLIFFACTKKNTLTALASGSAISAIASSASSTGATITWTTSAVATSKVYYGTTTSFGSSTTEADTGTSMTRNHSVNITGLSANTKYYYYVASKDASNNTTILGDDGSYSFTTTAAGPTITNVSATSSTSTSATVTWTTNEAATSQVFYGLTSSFGSNTTETTATSTSHTVSLTGLTASTTYYYYVRSKNAAGNASTSGDNGSKTFYTAASSSSSTFYIYFDDIKIEGTTGTPVIIYDDNLGSSVITGGTSNAAYMGSPNNGVDNIAAIDFQATDDKNSGTASWKVTMTKTTGWWAGIYILGTGEWRANWTGSTPSPANLSGPTGTVKLTCYAKVVGKTSTKIKIGIGDDSGATVDDSITGGKKESAKLDITNTWTKLELDLTGQSLTSINGVFFWSIDGNDVL